MAVLTLGAGCVARGDEWVAPHGVSPPYPVGGALLLRDTLRQRIWTVAADGAEVKVSHASWSGKDHVAQTTPDGKALLLLDLKRKQLAVARPGAAVVEYPMPVAFGGLATSDDGRVVGLWHQDGGKAAGGIVNTSELALVDLTQPAGKSAVRSATVAGLAAVPQALRIGPEFEGPGGKHRLVWFEAQSALGFVDFGPAGITRTTVVPLVAPDSKAIVVAKRIVLRTQPGFADLYLIADGSNDVVHLTLDLTGEQLAVTLDQIASGPTPADVALVDTAQGPRVLTVHLSTALLALLDPATGAGIQVALDSVAHTIVPFVDKDGKSRALLWTKGFAAVRVVDVGDLAKKKGKAVQKLTLESGAQSVHATSDGLFMVLHGAGFGGMSVVDPRVGKVTAFRNAGDLIAVEVRGNTAWTAGRVTVGGVQQIRLAKVNLATLTAASLELAVQADALYPFGPGVALTGGGQGGLALVALPGGTLDPGGVRFAEGLTLEGVMP